jgi:hypothetical protein
MWAGTPWPRYTFAQLTTMTNKYGRVSEKVNLHGDPRVAGLVERNFSGIWCLVSHQSSFPAWLWTFQTNYALCGVESRMFNVWTWLYPCSKNNLKSACIIFCFICSLKPRSNQNYPSIALMSQGGFWSHRP